MKIIMPQFSYCYAMKYFCSQKKSMIEALTKHRAPPYDNNENKLEMANCQMLW